MNLSTDCTPQNFKTLVARGKSGQYYVYVIPIAREVDLKLAPKAAGEKSVEMIHVKEINAITGYIRGGCSPIGMKKQFPTFLDESAQQFETIYISGGKIGVSICLSPNALCQLIRGKFVSICA